MLLRRLPLLAPLNVPSPSAATHKPRLPLPYLDKSSSSPMGAPSPVSIGNEAPNSEGLGRDKRWTAALGTKYPMPLSKHNSVSRIEEGRGCCCRSVALKEDKKRKEKSPAGTFLFSPAFCLKTPKPQRCHSCLPPLADRFNVSHACPQTCVVEIRQCAVASCCFLLLPMRVVSEPLTISKLCIPDSAGRHLI